MSRRLLPGRWNTHGVAEPDIVPPPPCHRLPSCKPLPKLEQRPSRERVVAEICVTVAAVFFAASCIALLVAARH